jgi:hypothetical protein
MYLIIMFGPIVTWILVGLTFNLLTRFISFCFLFGSLFLSLVFCGFIVYEVVYLNSFCLVELNTWFKLGVLNITCHFISIS